MTHASPSLQKPAADLQRVLGPFDATCIVIGAIIGVGIFFTPSKVAAIAGSAELALTAWMVGGAIALAGALTFAALGQTYHSAGAQYEILRDAYGPLPAFLFVFCNATAIQAGAIAVIANFCARNLSLLVTGAAPSDVLLTLQSIVLIAGLMIANALGVRWGSGIQIATVVAKVVTLIVLVVLALFIPAAPTPPPPTPDVTTQTGATPGALGVLSLVFAAIVPAFFAYGGWQHALWISGEVRDPRRNIPRSIIAGVLVVVVVYVSFNWALFDLIGYAGVLGSLSPAADAAGRAWGDIGRTLIAAAMTVSAFGVLNAQLLSGPRLIYRMAGDGRFFSPFARLSGRFGTPVWAIALLGGAASILLLSISPEQIDWLTAWVVIIDSVFFVLTGAALLVLRQARTEKTPPKSVGYPVVPALFVLGEAGIVVGACMNPNLWRPAAYGAAWIGVAVVLYFACFRKSAN